MPVLWFSSFNGMEPFYIAQGCYLDNRHTNTSAIAFGEDNPLNRYFGTGSTGAARGNGTASPIIMAYGMKYSPSSTYTARCCLCVQPSSFAANTKCLAGVFYQAANDWRFGFQFNLLNLFPQSATKSWRVGFRFGCPNHPTQSTYQTHFGGIGMNHNASNNAVYQWWSSSQFAANKGREYYIEIEWIHTTGMVTIYVDDQMVWTGAEPTKYKGSGFTVSHVFYSGSGTFPVFEVRDMYIQSIESDADVRLGSSTTVSPAALASDDAVAFTRPSGYDSNASVAAVPVKTIPSSYELNVDPILGATAVGDQDLYNLNVTNVNSTLSSIEGVIVRGQARNPLNGARKFQMIGSSSGTVAEGALSPANPGNLLTPASIVMLSDPATGMRWDAAKLANLKVGMKFKE